MTTEWKDLLAQEKQQPYFKEILHQIKSQRIQGKIIYPPDAQIFEAFRLTPLQKLKVIILGQDPYHGPNQAHGLSFSVVKGVKKPPSLQNILKELHQDLGFDIPKSGQLDKWALQGVLLLNTYLSVEAGNPQSHANLGWLKFTDKVICLLNGHCEHLVYILWGAHAQKKIPLIDTTRHSIIKSPHPSPLSAHRGFFNSHPFSKANDALRKHGQEIIDWSL